MVKIKKNAKEHGIYIYTCVCDYLHNHHPLEVTGKEKSKVVKQLCILHVVIKFCNHFDRR